MERRRTELNYVKSSLLTLKPAMSKPKLDSDRLRQFLDAGHTQADAARHFDVTEPAIHQRIKHMQRLTSQVIALEGEFDVEFPDHMLKRNVFNSIESMLGALQELSAG